MYVWRVEQQHKERVFETHFTTTATRVTNSSVQLDPCTFDSLLCYVCYVMLLWHQNELQKVAQSRRHIRVRATISGSAKFNM